MPKGTPITMSEVTEWNGGSWDVIDAPTKPKAKKSTAAYDRFDELLKCGGLSELIDSTAQKQLKTWRDRKAELEAEIAANDGYYPFTELALIGDDGEPAEIIETVVRQGKWGDYYELVAGGQPIGSVGFNVKAETLAKKFGVMRTTVNHRAKVEVTPSAVYGEFDVRPVKVYDHMPIGRAVVAAWRQSRDAGEGGLI